ncbi:hypothetical protein WJX74_003480 [Apatococcus lobatus]|uniref:Nuclear pore complex protein n=1 Tax=Apatococcus lobatus TaxID=904363 RepID=A0AAW1SDF9_9CHLO
MDESPAVPVRPPELLVGDSPDQPNPLYQDLTWTPHLSSLGNAAAFSGRKNPLWSPDQPSAAMHAEQPQPATFAGPETGPSASAAQQLQQANADIFSGILAQQMEGQIPMQNAVLSFSDACRTHAQDLRRQAAQQHRTLRALQWQRQAEELEAEAATWSLLSHLQGNPDLHYPAGGLEDMAGGRPSLGQRAAAIVARDRRLNRVARLVAWLEDLAASQFDQEQTDADRNGAMQGFSAADGIWEETRWRLQQAQGHSDASSIDGLIVSLDPDAPTRERKGPSAEDAKQEERLTSHLFRLLRCGRLQEACSVASQASQPWRATSMAGGGPYGPLPLGPAAQDVEAANRTESMAGEDEHGLGASRALWKWGCYQAAEKASEVHKAWGSHAGGGGEVATYAALAGHLQCLLPLSTCWEDACWALSRCWLDCEVDRRLSSEAAPAQVACEQLKGNLGSCAAGVDMGILAEGLSLVEGNWPLPRMLQELPKSQQEMFDKAAGWLGTSGSSPTPSILRFQQYQIQLALATSTEDQDALAESLASLLQGLYKDCLPQGPVQAQRRGADDIQLLRFGAHFVLALRLLADTTSACSAPVSDARSLAEEALLRHYVKHLVITGQQDMVPLYACHVQEATRRDAYMALMDLLSEQPMDTHLQVVQHSHDTFETWRECSPETRLQPDAMQTLAEQYVSEARQATQHGPAYRARAMQWMCCQQHDLALQAALHQATSLFIEFALAGQGGIAAAECLVWVLDQQATVQSAASVADDSQDLELQHLVQSAETWIRFFAILREHRRWWAGWQDLTEGRGVAQAGAEEVADLLTRCGYLAGLLLDFVHTGRLDTPAPDPLPTQGVQNQIQMDMAAVEAASPDVEAGRAFAQMTRADADRVAAALDTGLTAAVAAAEHLQDSLGVQVVGAGCSNESGSSATGVIRIAASWVHPEAGQAAARLLSLVLKRALPSSTGSWTAPSLQVQSLKGSSHLQMLLCQHLCYPNLLLKCAQLRQVLLQLGQGHYEEFDVLPTMFGVDAKPGLSALFSQAELQELMEIERRNQLVLLQNRSEDAL